MRFQQSFLIEMTKSSWSWEGVSGKYSCRYMALRKAVDPELNEIWSELIAKGEMNAAQGNVE